MVVRAVDDDHELVDMILPAALLAGLSLTGVSFAIAKALKPGTKPGRQAELWILAVLLSLVALGVVLAGWWLSVWDGFTW